MTGIRSPVPHPTNYDDVHHEQSLTANEGNPFNHESGFDVFTISEILLSSYMEDVLTSIPGYQFMRAGRKTEWSDGQTKQGGGLGIYFCK